MHHSVRLNKAPTWCNKMQILLLQTFSTCFGCHAVHHREYKILTRQPPVQVVTVAGGSSLCQIRDKTDSFVPNMAKWGSTCNRNYLYRWLPCQCFILLMMGAWRPKHVEKVCSNKSASCCITSVFYLTLRIWTFISYVPWSLWVQFYTQDHS